MPLANNTLLDLGLVRQLKNIRGHDGSLDRYDAIETRKSRNRNSLHRLLPDRHALFHFVDEPLAGGERFLAVGRDDFHP